ELLLARLAGVDDLEGTDGEGDEVARERLRGRELHRLPAVLRRGLAGLGRVREDELILRGLDRDRPRRLEAGLVEAGERAARVGRLELGEDVPVAALFLAIGALAVARRELAVVGHAHLPRARRERLAEAEADELLSALLDPSVDHRSLAGE